MSGVPGFQRRSPRVVIDQQALLIDGGGRELPVKVIELSAGGFRLDVGEMLAVGEKVAIRVDRYGEYKGEIRWATELQAGGIFLEPVEMSAL